MALATGGPLRRILFLFIIVMATQALAFEARVLIDDDKKQNELVGEITIHCEADGVIQKACPRRHWFLKKGHWKLERKGAFLKITETKAKKVFQLKLKHYRFSGNFQLKGHALERLDLVFEKNKTNWVAFVPVDQYLYGVMANEVPASWPAEALKAQAVASRTYFLFKKMERRDQFFDVHSDVMDQVYSLDAKKYTSIIEAVNQTHGMVLMDKLEQKIFAAYFHSDCGGATSSEGAVWRNPSSVNRSVKDPFCKAAKRNNWTFSMDQHELTHLLQGALMLPVGVQLENILPRIHEEQNRAHYVDFLFSENIFKRINANELRKLIGFSKLRSTSFNVKRLLHYVIFEGRGFGHGVGMCQWGAQRWARQGKDFRSILQHYYPSAVLKKVTEKEYKSLQAQMAF